MIKIFKSRIYLASLLLSVSLGFGILGYRFISNYDWIDALYMTVITITTVGFGEVNPLTNADKVFTIFLILFSVVILGYVISVFTEYMFTRRSYEEFKHKTLEKKIQKLKDHVIVCGFGRNGREAVEKLKSYKKEFVIVEMDEDLVSKQEDDDTMFCIGNANEDETLIRAGIDQASALICAMPEDADNLFTVLSARQLNKNLKIISRASVDTSFRKLKLAGADNVILPDKIGGDHMASLVVMPDLVEFLDNLSVSGQDNVNVREILYEHVCPDNIDKTIREVDLRNLTGCTIIGYKNPAGDYVVNPEASTLITKGSKLIVIGKPNQINTLRNEFNI